MKYIITEQQELRLSILRRIDEDWPLIQEIVDEGVDLDDPCDFNTVEKYVFRVCRDSARTYLFHYFDIGDEREGTEFSKLLKYYHNLIQDRMGQDIMEYWLEKQDECF